MEIRRSVPADAKEIAAAEIAVFQDPWCERDITDAISQSGSMCYTATSDGKVVAYIIGRQISPEGEIYRIATLPSHRRRGIAYRLLDYAVKCERGKGLESLFLEVREKNIPARNLYKSYGFREIGVRKNYYKNPPDNAIVMLHCHSADL